MTTRDTTRAWKGDLAGYKAIHGWFGVHFPNRKCEDCGKTKGQIDFALKHGRKYSRNVKDYRQLCKGCHRKYDLTGVKFSDDHKKKLSVSIKKSWLTRKQK